MFTPENDLERLLVKAAGSAAALPEFYKVFVASKIFFVDYGATPSESAGESTLPTGTKIGIQPIILNGKPCLPIFSSLTRLQEFLQHEAAYMQVNVMDFLNLTKGAELILNPRSQFGKTFTPAEVQSILDGSLWRPSKTYVTQTETKVRIGQPEKYPHALAEALSQLFQGIKEVESAYLAHFHSPDQGDPPHTLIGVKASSRWEEIIAEAGIVVLSVNVPNPPVDFVRIGENGGFDNYCSTIKPFYKRKVFGLF